MKPYLLVILMAIPALIGNILATEASEPATPAAQPNACSDTPASSTTSTTTTIPAKSSVPAPAAVPAAKPAPTSTNAPAHPKPWFM